MKKIKAITFAVLLALVAATSITNAGPVNPPAPNATLDCRDGQSDVNLQVGVTNQGPEVIPAGTTIYVSYQRVGSSEPRLTRAVTSLPIAVGKTTKLELGGNWYPQIEQCKASLTAPKIKMPTSLIN